LIRKRRRWERRGEMEEEGRDGMRGRERRGNRIGE
jgi:hypothetical protein